MMPISIRLNWIFTINSCKTKEQRANDDLFKLQDQLGLQASSQPKYAIIIVPLGACRGCAGRLIEMAHKNKGSKKLKFVLWSKARIIRIMRNIFIIPI